MPRDQSFLIRHADTVFALKTFAAAMLALLIALWLDLPRPYWAMATVYITSQPLAGATSSKAFYRVLGTLTGATVSVIFVPNLVNAPELLSLTVALWVGLCLYLSLLDRRPHSYAFMLAGYTAAMICFPSVNEPGSIFDVAVARAQEITLGILCAALVSTVVFPRAVTPIVTDRVDGWLHDAQQIAYDVLTGRNLSQRTQHRLRLAAEAVEIDLLASHLDYDRPSDVNTIRGLQVLRKHMLMLLPLLVSIRDRMEAIGGDIREQYPDLSQLLEQLAQWIVTGADERQSPDELRAAIAELRPRLGGSSSWNQLMMASLLVRLRDLVNLSQDCRNLRRAIADGADVSHINLAFHPASGAALVRHRDHGMALWSAAGAAFVILICCAFWIVTGWADGSSAPMMAAIVCSFFAAQDDPVPSIRNFGVWSFVAIIVVAVYQFAILPGISNVESLIAALAPTFILFGFLIARPKTAPIGTVLAAISATLLALQETYSADFAAYANSSLSFLFGMAAATVGIKVARSVGAEWIARRLMQTSWETLAEVAERRGKQDRSLFTGLMLDRLGMLAQRLAAIPQPDQRDVENLSQLRVGINIIDLRRARHHVRTETLSAIDDALAALTTAAHRHASGPMPLSLLSLIDTAISEALQEPAGTAREDALIGLSGIRRGLFPTGDAYTPEPFDLQRIAA